MFRLLRLLVIILLITHYMACVYWTVFEAKWKNEACTSQVPLVLTDDADEVGFIAGLENETDSLAACIDAHQLDKCVEMMAPSRRPRGPLTSSTLRYASLADT